MVDKDVSTTFRVAGVLATFLIVAIHYNSMYHIDVTEYGSLNFNIQQFITNALGRVSVPFFALSSGFFYYIGIQRYNQVSILAKKRIKSLLIPYTIGALLILTGDIVFAVYRGEAVSTVIMPVSRIFLHPESVQYWFLRDLIVLGILLAPLQKYLMHISTFIAAISAVLWGLEYQPFPIVGGWYLMNIEVFFFFYLGTALAKRQPLLIAGVKLLSDKNTLFFTVVIFLSIVFLRIYQHPTFGVWYGISGGGSLALLLYKAGIIIGLIILLATSYHLRNSRILIYLAQFSFFIFLFHLKPLSYFILKAYSFIDDQFLFYFTTPTAILVTIISAYLLKTYLPRFADVLLGGR